MIFELQLSGLLPVALTYLTLRSARATLLILLCVAAHEAGHVLAALSVGVKVKAVGCNLKGAYTRRMPCPEWDWMIAGAGPAMNLLLSPVLYACHAPTAVFQINLLIGLFNILPLRGCDGFRLWKLDQRPLL